MADPGRFGRSEREYTGVPRRGLSKYNRFGGSERTFTGVTDRTGNKYRRFGPSEKEYTERRYTPMGQGTTWDFTGEKRRKMPGYDLGARPPQGLDYLISKQGFIGQDPRSATYGAPWDYRQTSPDDLRGYRSSVADVAAANAAEEQERLRNKYRYAFTNPGSGVGIEEQYVGYPPGMADYLGIEEYGLGAVPKDPRDVETMSETMYDWPFGPFWGATDDMSDYRQSWDPQMNEQTALNLKLLGDLDRGGTDEYRFANIAPVSIGEREDFRSPPMAAQRKARHRELPDGTLISNALIDRINRDVEKHRTSFRLGLGDHPGRYTGKFNRGGIASLPYAR